MSKNKSFSGVSNDIKHHHGHPVLSFMLGLMALGILVATGFFSFVQFNNYQDSKPASSFNVTGMAEQEIEATEATISFSLKQTGVDTAALNSQLDTQTTALKQFLTEKGIAPSQIQINKNSYEEYRYPEDPSKPKEFTVQAQFSVKVLNTKEQNTNELYQQIIQRGVKDIQPIQYSVANQESICENLVNKAIENAREKSTQRLNALKGTKIIRDSVTQSYGCGQNQGVIAYGSPEARSADVALVPAPDVLSGNEKLQATVEMTVDYR
jgi:uncharacterized protein YggE